MAYNVYGGPAFRIVGRSLPYLIIVGVGAPKIDYCRVGAIGCPPDIRQMAVWISIGQDLCTAKGYAIDYEGSHPIKL
jgi:hypothetical protein